MKKNLFFGLIFLLFSTIASLAQEKVTLSGTIANASDNETLIGVNLVFEPGNIGITTNSYGFYSVTLPRGRYNLSISYIGFETIETEIALTDNTKRNFQLKEMGNLLEEIVITSNQTKANIRKPEMSVNKLSIGTIRKMPAVLGEVDVLKSILQLPGVSNAQEGSAGFNVRGGAADGNLVLLDEAIVYNTSHLFGFFSVFNSDVIKDLKLYKGGIPANFGGRVSSVLDIYQKEGNNKEYHLSGGIGIVSSRLLVEGPIVKEKGSFVFAGRTSYANIFLQASGNESRASFYDMNGKVNYKFSDKNAVFVSGYYGNDKINIRDNFINSYGNSFLNLRWNHVFSDKLFSNASAIYSDYNYGLELQFIGLDWKSDIKNYNFKYDFQNYISDKLTLNFGMNTIYYQFNPGTIGPLDETSAINFKQIARKKSFENAYYVSAEHDVTSKLSLHYGLRFSTFFRLGAQTFNTYENNQPVFYNSELQIYEKAAPTGTISYGNNKEIASFTNLEPRFAIAYTINSNQSVKASYNRMSQYIHLISNTQSISPLDVWTPSDQYFKPEILDQVALGYFRNFDNAKYSLEAETFYKTIKNKTDYIDGADLIANEAIEQVILNGEARSYGFELMLRKNTGKLSGWISYTLSKAEQKTAGRTAEEPGINNGEWYRANYDKRHNLSATAAYAFTNKWTCGGIFTFQSGRAATFPNALYEYQGITIPSYGLRNENSLSAYHHLDISATYTPKPNKKKGWQGEWVFSIYNLYNRRNAATYTFAQNESTGINEVTRISIFGIIPGITYNFKF